jgi:hypothetical protein
MAHRHHVPGLAGADAGLEVVGYRLLLGDLVIPQPQPPASGLRVSDAERDAVAAELAEHLRVGRLDLDEFDERVGQAIHARTRGDLDRLLTDLPRPMPPPPAVRHRAGPPFALIAALIFVAGVATLGALSHGAATWGHAGWHQHPVWPFWLLWWLIPLAIVVARRRHVRGPSGGHRP